MSHNGKIIGLSVFTVVALFACITMFALEGQDVAVLRTHTETGVIYETRVWLAEVDGSVWVEAATPEREFYQHILQRPDVEVFRAGKIEQYTATVHPGETGHAKIRHLLREKYGWADWWVGLLQDTSQSVAVQLTLVREGF